MMTGTTRFKDLPKPLCAMQKVFQLLLFLCCFKKMLLNLLVPLFVDL